MAKQLLKTILIEKFKKSSIDRENSKTIVTLGYVSFFTRIW